MIYPFSLWDFAPLDRLIFFSFVYFIVAAYISYDVIAGAEAKLYKSLGIRNRAYKAVTIFFVWFMFGGTLLYIYEYLQVRL